MGGFAVPADGLGEILFYAPAVLVAKAQVVLRPCVALFGGLAIPLNGHGGVLFYDPAVFVAETKIELCPGVALLGGFAVPADGQGFVLFYAFAVFVAKAQFGLRRGIALFGGRSQIGQALESVRFLPVPLIPLLRRGALLCLPLAAQGAGRLGGCHREGGGVAFVIAGPVIPAGGADGGCVILLVTYRAFPHGGSSLVVYA